MTSSRAVVRPASLGVAAVLAVAAVGMAAPTATAAAGGVVRVDQVGYAIEEAKVAYLLAPAAVPNARFSVVNGSGRTVLSGKVGASRGSWNTGYQAVHPIDLSAVRWPGTYRVTLSGAVTASSPAFRVDSGSALLNPLADKTTQFFQAQRDGAEVIPGPLNRKPAHLTDRRATVYDTPKFKGAGGDEIAEPLKPVGGPVDLEGGWFDAGDFVKFTSNTAYSLAEMLLVQRGQQSFESAVDSAGRGDRALAAETRHGLKWLDKAWDERTKTLYAQVGIGTGSEEFNFVGDHDVWRLPEADDALQVKPGDREYFIKHRPVFRAAAPGQPISPNLAGRVAAAFAIGAQVEAGRNPQLARQYLDQAASVFAQAKTTDVGELVTAFPHSYYPEDSWTDDLEFGATELALAARRLHDPRAAGWARAATHWAKQYLASGDTDTLNLYNTSAIAHADLAKLLGDWPVAGAEVSRRQLVDDLKAQLQRGQNAAASSPFRTAANLTNFDAATRSFGFAATARLYREMTGDRSFDAFGTQQRNFTLGANAWGLSLMVGAGTTFAQCPHHQAANLAGSPNGGSRILVGAVINGPNGADNFTDLGDPPPGHTPCSKSFAAFDGQGAQFFDDLRSWPSSEPAIDFTSTAMLAFGLGTQGW